MFACIYTVLAWQLGMRFQPIDLVYCWSVREVKATAVILDRQFFIISSLCRSMFLICLLSMLSASSHQKKLVRRYDSAATSVQCAEYCRTAIGLVVSM